MVMCEHGLSTNLKDPHCCLVCVSAKYSEPQIKQNSEIMNNEIEDRKTVLLRATLELLKKCNDGPYVKDVFTETVFYDGVDCDAGCLANDIACLLGEEPLRRW